MLKRLDTAKQSPGAVKVPFFDWQGLYNERADEFSRIMDETARRGGFILQKDVDELEERLVEVTGAKHAIAVSDGTNGILLGLRAMGLEHGSEIIIQSHSFIAAAQSIHFAGCTPVPVELGDDWMMDVDHIEQAITEKTAAIMPVQVNGRMCDMDSILEIADRHNLTVVEDSAQALGAEYKGRGAGTIGLWGTYSFYPSKTLGCFGDAGALVTSDDDIAEAVRSMRNHGANVDKQIARDITLWGTNSRLDNIHAAILVYKLAYYDEAIARRREIAAQYHEAFKSIPGLSLPPGPDEDPDRFDIFQNYEVCSDRRDELRACLAENDIGTIIQWGGSGLHHMHGLGFTQALPKTDKFFDTSLLLPMNHILTDAQVEHVISTVSEFYGA